MAAPTRLLLALYFLLHLHFYPTRSSNEQLQALLNFKNSIFFDGTLALADWNSSDPSPCSWNGITCKTHLVIAITLPKSKLKGSLSPSLGNVSSLRHLNLRNNELHGDIPSVLFAGISGLQSIILSENSLSGSLPRSLFSCKRLKVLDLAGNGFSGEIPAGFGGAFSLLERVNLSFNEFSGAVPGDLDKLTSLQSSIDLSHNFFAGGVPENLGTLPEKVFIDLSYNNLSGRIPQTGSLLSRGALGFIGNPNLCGPQLKECDSSSRPSLSAARKLSGGTFAAIIGGDIAAIALMGIIFFICYRRATKQREFTRLVNQEPPSKLKFLDNSLSFELEELLKSSAAIMGKSKMGILYKVELDEGLTMAVRRLGEGGSQRFMEFKAEVEKIAELRHPNIVPLRAYFWSSEEKLLIYDYIPFGNLSTAVHGGDMAAPRLPWRGRMKIMKGVARGLAFLHEFRRRKYVHGDLKPGNILLGGDMDPLIADFGLRRLAEISSPEKTLEKSPEKSYRAPESEKDESRASQKWDVYSYGVLALEMITGRSPAVTIQAAGVGLVRWVQLCLEEEKNLGDLLDPFLLREEEEEEEAEKEGEEIVGALKIALSCVHSRPDRRPSMRHVLDCLEHL